MFEHSPTSSEFDVPSESQELLGYPEVSPMTDVAKLLENMRRTTIRRKPNDETLDVSS